jgi:hypothetical protein
MFAPGVFNRSDFMFGSMTRGGFYGMMFGYPVGSINNGLSVISWSTIFLFAAAMGFVGVMLSGSRKPGMIFLGAILVLISAVISYPTVWVFGIGSAIMIVGAILSLMKIFQFKD